MKSKEKVNSEVKKQNILSIYMGQPYSLGF